MPRKQRFKPSRKPKPIPTEQAQGGRPIGELATAQAREVARAPDVGRVETVPDPRAPQYHDPHASR